MIRAMESPAQQRPIQVQVATYVTPELASLLRAMAEREERSVAQELRLAIKTWVAMSDRHDERQAA